LAAVVTRIERTPGRYRRLEIVGEAVLNSALSRTLGELGFVKSSSVLQACMMVGVGAAKLGAAGLTSWSGIGGDENATIVRGKIALAGSWAALLPIWMKCWKLNVPLVVGDAPARAG
jgi:hypothetical protein